MGDRKVFLWIGSNFVVSKILVFLGGENGKVFLYNFFEHPKEIVKPAGLNPFVSGQAFTILISHSFHIYIGTLLLVKIGQNWEYESRFDLIISNQPYWNFHGFLFSWWDLLGFPVPWGTEKLLGCCLLGWSVPRLTPWFIFKCLL